MEDSILRVVMMRAIEKYNLLHVMESEASIEHYEGSRFYILLTHDDCDGCNPYNLISDLAGLLEESGFRAVLEDVEEADGATMAVLRITPQRLVSAS